MKKVILSVITIVAFASCEPIQPISAFALDFEMWNIPQAFDEGVSLPQLQMEGQINPIQLFRADEIADSLFSVCDCDSVFTKTVAVR